MATEKMVLPTLLASSIHFMVYGRSPPAVMHKEGKTYLIAEAGDYGANMRHHLDRLPVYHPLPYSDAMGRRYWPVKAPR